jgi:hypothetical protein
MSPTGPSRHFGARPNLVATGGIADIDECTLLLLPRRRSLPQAEQVEVEGGGSRPRLAGIDRGQVPLRSVFPARFCVQTAAGAQDRMEALENAVRDGASMDGQTACA